ncbi:DUF4352 domain-containing protein [Brochothrix thermosphacta]|uniref:DUF4352 domain-containing protein n=1 Tax=Brochothrix thermosphacta TaxID=2756 RepID=UPI00083FAB2E|nr:DUF4352 domain-containing protein [Brochothrix thermosphacta]ODJ54833.1 hypothetical protein BFR41_06940 [Brochothrix thermosphacta]ODJ63276.1 hypothetical protein BFR35_01465 [Brochothrix thermosphacta]ODJ66919.1 hypothetical protein BFR37_07305 [Brochothrix thermosphacta]
MAKQIVKGEDGKEYEVRVKKPFYKKWWVWVLIVLVLLFIIGAVGGNSDNEDTPKKNTSTKSKTKSEEKLDKEYKVGETVSYKGYEITVNSIEFPKPGEYDSIDDGKKYAEVNITINNKTGETQSYNPYDFQISENGTRHDFNAFRSESKDELNSGELDDGATVSGNMTAEVKEDSKLQLVYKASIWNDKTVRFNLD